MLDIGPTTPLNTDAQRARINVRQHNKRPPTAARLRLIEPAGEPVNVGDAASHGDEPAQVVSWPAMSACCTAR